MIGPIQFLVIWWSTFTISLRPQHTYTSTTLGKRHPRPSANSSVCHPRAKVRTRNEFAHSNLARSEWVWQNRDSASLICSRRLLEVLCLERMGAPYHLRRFGENRLNYWIVLLLKLLLVWGQSCHQVQMMVGWLMAACFSTAVSSNLVSQTTENSIIKAFFAQLQQVPAHPAQQVSNSNFPCSTSVVSIRAMMSATALRVASY